MKSINKIFTLGWKVITKPKLFWTLLKQWFLYFFRYANYGEIHASVVIRDSRMIKHKKHIFFKGSAYVMPGCRIEPVLRYEGCEFNPTVVIEDQVSINQYIHLTCANKISIGKNTNIAAFVTITDISHPYEDVSIPIKKAKLKVGDVTIGEGCEIYNGAVILPNVHIGNHCVIGAHAIVTQDVPDFSVVVGAPAKIVKTYNHEKKMWQRVN